MPPPRVRVRPAVPADRDIMARIHSDAFAPGVMSQLMTPAGNSEEDLAQFASFLFPDDDNGKTAAEEDESKESSAPSPYRRLPNGTEAILTVAELLPGDDGESGEIVAWAKWNLRRHARPEEEWNVQEPVRIPGEGRNHEVTEDFLGGLRQMALKCQKGNALLHLDMLVCSPNHQRLGAGSALLRDGLAVADELGLPAWTEASPAGYPVYRRLGFSKDVDCQDLEITEKWGRVRGEGEDWGQNSGVEQLGPLKEGYFRTVEMKRPAVVQ